jgi:hypothetical protein
VGHPHAEERNCWRSWNGADGGDMISHAYMKRLGGRHPSGPFERRGSDPPPRSRPAIATSFRDHARSRLVEP